MAWQTLHAYFRVQLADERDRCRARNHGGTTGASIAEVTERRVLDTVIRAYAASWAARDREAWLRTFATDATQEDPVGVPVRRGHREIGEFWDREMARYQSIEIVPREIFVIDHEAAMVWTINGVTDEGPGSFDGVDVFQFEDAGLISSVRAFWERTSPQRQIQGLSR